MANHLGLIYDALVSVDLSDLGMMLVALGTIRAELGNFIPRSEGRSRYNAIIFNKPTSFYCGGGFADPVFTLPDLGGATGIVPGQPEDRSLLGIQKLDEYVNNAASCYAAKAGSKYDYNTNLGNTRFGDGARYIGRGFVQITGKHNYSLYGEEIGRPWLVRDPELANNPGIAAELLAEFLKGAQRPVKERHREHHEKRIRAALEKGAMGLKDARKAVNGGSNGFDHFQQAFISGIRKAIELDWVTNQQGEFFIGREIKADRGFSGFSSIA